MVTTSATTPSESAGDPLAWIDRETSALAGKGLARRLVAHAEAEPGRLAYGGRLLVNFASNDYLGLAADPRVIAAATETAARYGWGSGASALVCGWRIPHETLAAELADFEGTEAAVLFPTGYAANLGALAALVGPGDAVYGDRLNHSCLVAGTRMAGASLRVYPHGDTYRLAEILRRDCGRFRRALIATDGVFSMDGDLAPLAELAELADRFGAMLLVDEAHGTGVFGAGGRGASEALQVADQVHVKVGTLSKALGSIGGFVAGSRRLINHLVNRSPTLIYSTALPPAAAAAASEALHIVRGEPQRRHHLKSLAEKLRCRLRSAGLDVGGSVGPIIPVIVGEPDQAMGLADYLRRLGYLVPAIRPPTVPSGTARLRISLSASHIDDDIEGLMTALAARGSW